MRTEEMDSDRKVTNSNPKMGQGTGPWPGPGPRFIRAPGPEPEPGPGPGPAEPETLLKESQVRRLPAPQRVESQLLRLAAAYQGQVSSSETP